MERAVSHHANIVSLAEWQEILLRITFYKVVLWLAGCKFTLALQSHFDLRCRPVTGAVVPNFPLGFELIQGTNQLVGRCQRIKSMTLV